MLGILLLTAVLIFLLPVLGVLAGIMVMFFLMMPLVAYVAARKLGYIRTAMFGAAGPAAHIVKQSLPIVWPGTGAIVVAVAPATPSASLRRPKMWDRLTLTETQRLNNGAACGRTAIMLLGAPTFLLDRP